LSHSQACSRSRKIGICAFFFGRHFSIDHLVSLHPFPRIGGIGAQNTPQKTKKAQQCWAKILELFLLNTPLTTPCVDRSMRFLVHADPFAA
jgi:hypothetical protein